MVFLGKNMAEHAASRVIPPYETLRLQSGSKEGTSASRNPSVNPSARRTRGVVAMLGVFRKSAISYRRKNQSASSPCMWCRSKNDREDAAFRSMKRFSGAMKNCHVEGPHV